MKGVLHIMKLIFTKSSLNKAVGIVMKAVPTRTTMSILECILIDASTNEIKFTANDMELGIETIVEGEIIEKGKVAIDAKIFSEIVRKLPDNDITIETDDNYTSTITCEKSKFNIAGKSGDDFSYLPVIIKEKSISLSQFTLKETINQTIFCTSPNDNNKMMTGELFEVKDNVLKVVGLDGHRIAIRNINLSGNADDVKVVVPGKTLNEISKILSSDAESVVNIYFTNNHILFEFDNTMVVSRLIEGEYFKINQMLSNDYETKVVINKKEFLDSIDRANLLIREGDKKPIIINITDGSLEVKVQSAIGSLNEDIDINKEGKDIMIGFNPKFLIDALRVIDDETVDIYLVNPKAPCFIRDKEENYIYLILPVNFSA
jgi:DNA polymerase III subunit beta